MFRISICLALDDVSRGQRRWYELSFAGGELQESTLSRSRQVTGCIGLLRQRDLVKEIGQTCGRSATMRPER